MVISGFEELKGRLGDISPVPAVVAAANDRHTLQAVFAASRDPKNALSSWRISLSHLTTQEELDGFLRAFDACYTRLTQL